MDEWAVSSETRFAPPARVLLLSRTKKRHDALLRAFADAGAVVEEVGEFPALLERMNRDPRPDLVVLGCESAAGDSETPMLSLAIRSIAAGEGEATIPPAAEKAADKLGFLQLLRSVEMLIAGANAEPQDATTRNNTPATENLDLRLEASRVLWKGKRVDLSLTEFRIVCHLARPCGRDVGHRELYDIIKGDGFVSGQGKDGYRCNVRAAIKRIRQKFRLVDPEFAAIRSYHGFGYRWDDEANGADAPEGDG